MSGGGTLFRAAIEACAYGVAAAAILLVIPVRFASHAQNTKAVQHESYVGDAPADPGPLAKDVSGALNQHAIQHVLRKVADWQSARAESHFDQDWTYAALYRGLIAASRATGDSKYEDAVRNAAKRFEWKLGPRIAFADDEAVAQSYLHFYFESRDASMIAPTKAAFDQVISAPPDTAKPLWWWCDALFMAPVAWVKLSDATKNPAYADFMDKRVVDYLESALRPERPSVLARRDVSRSPRSQRA